jgi:hypothetical protein
MIKVWSVETGERIIVETEDCKLRRDNDKEEKEKKKKKVDSESAPSHHQALSLTTILTEVFRGFLRLSR